jgi:peptide deformylase
MLLKISEMPSDIKLCKILTFDKITKKSSYIDNLPKPEEPIINKIQMTKETAMAESEPKPLISEALKNACWRMIRSCLADDGVGLAAPQIGIMKRLFIIRQNADHFKVYFHPKYTVDINSKIDMGLEGCLSVPGKYLNIPRQTMIMAEWVEINSEEQLVSRTELLEGYLARVFQHEYDHIEGISIVDRARQAKTL